MPVQQWYPDPTGRHQMRYWDGQRWTDHVSDNGIQAVDAVDGRGTPPGAVSPGVGWGTPTPAPAPTHQGGPGYGYGGEPRRTMEHPQGTTILVLGIIGLIVCTPILSPIAWVMGQRARNEIKSRPDVHYTNAGNVTAGWICGIVGSCLAIVVILIFVSVRR